MQQLEDVLNDFQACAHIEELNAVMHAKVHAIAVAVRYGLVAP